MEAQGRFRTALRHTLLDEMIRKVKPKGQQWKVLVVDREALRILAAALPLTELVNEGVTIVEMLDLRREPLPRLPAIYFITPTAESIHLFAAEQKTQYREFHLFFTGRLPDYQMDVIRQNSPLLRRVRSLVELNISFLAYESRLFSLDRPAASLPHLFGNEGGLSHRDARSEMALISERLTDACGLVAKHLHWTVRCDASSHVSRTVASLVKEQLETKRIEKMSSKKEPPTIESTKGEPKQATLIVLDRATDVVSPLIHEFSYQAMLHDLLKLDYRKPGGAHYTVAELEGKNGKPQHLPIDDEDKDPIWSSIRHLFIEHAKVKATSSLQTFLETDAAFKIGKKDAADIDIADMTKAVRNLPESQMRRDRYVAHVCALKECMEHCTAFNIPELAGVEQDVAIGMAPDGTRVGSKPMTEALLTTLRNEAIPIEHRVRTLLIALAVATEGTLWMGGEASLLVQSSQFRDKMRDSRLLNLPGQTRDLTASIHGLRKILTFTKSSSETKTGSGSATTVAGQYAERLKTKAKERKAYKRQEKDVASRRRRQGLDSDEVPFDVARYAPPVRAIIADLVSDTLDKSDFPITGAVDVDDIIQNVLRKPDPTELSIDDDPATAPSISRRALFSKAGALISRKSTNSDEEDQPPPDADPDHLYMVFFVGGVCYSEVRSAYEVCAKRGANIIVGGCHVLTPSMFLGALGGIADEALKIKVLLPPLPMDLAQMRQAREKALAEMKAKEEEEKRRADKAAIEAAVSSVSTKGQGRKAGKVVDTEDEDRPLDAEVVTVESYKKPSKFKKWFGKK